jgi:hypothetical protein
MVTRVLATPAGDRAFASRARGELGIVLFQAGQPQLAGVGAQLVEAVHTLPAKPSVAAWDFLTIALAVTATDRFVLRAAGADGWTRIIDIQVDLCDPTPWVAEAEPLAAALRFLTGDIWHIRFAGGGIAPPDVQSRETDRDCVCLFSGGLDSLIGAIDLISERRRPLLVSQASPKEGSVQAELATEIRLAEYRFEGRARERYAPPYEPSSRSRSLLFIAYGIVAASALVSAGVSPDFVHVPENGLISINPPLTRRRIGSLSTRTTHPFFMASLSQVLERAGTGIPLMNRYGWRTKGEMLAGCLDAEIVQRLAPRSYSCGKGKRLNQHCGRCVPCLIRRAAFHHAGVEDSTPYWATDLAASGRYDDVYASRTAAAAVAGRDMAQWAAEAGPLPEDPAARGRYVDVVRRGVAELASYLHTIAWV